MSDANISPQKNMSKLWASLIILLIFTLASCGRADKSTKGLTSLAVKNPAGKNAHLPVSKSQPVFGMATWCPFCKQFRDVLNDQRLKPYLKGVEVSFLFEESEWPTIERQLREIAQAEGENEQYVQTTITALKAKANFASVLDPSFFDVPVAKHYFAGPATNVSFQGFPSLFSASSRQFDRHPLEWLQEDIAVPAALLKKIWAAHDPADEP